MTFRHRSLRSCRLRWDELPDAQPYLRSATFLVKAQAQLPHRHDYHEVFWVDAGQVDHQVNEHAQPLAAGDVCFIRPDDDHALHGRSATITSCALPSAEHDRLKAAYGGDGAWPWDGGSAPRIIHLGPDGLAALADAVMSVNRADQRRCDLDWFVLTLLRRTHAQQAANPAIPPWLSEAVAGFRERGDLVNGIAMLVHLTRRSHAYVSRCVRRHYGVDLTSLVNGIRLEKAAHLLRRTTQPIPDIAARVGLPNLGNFYRQFSRRFACTPKAYRRR